MAMTHDEPAATVNDPVCGMGVDPATAKQTSEYRGQTYYFCSVMCKKAFEDDPQHYLTTGRHGDPTQVAGR
jgi:Cu+-exporting ATPase